MRKALIAAAAVLAIAGSSYSLAQTTPPAKDTPAAKTPSARDGDRETRRERRERRRAERRAGRGEDIAAMTDARVAALKAGLRLSADQEKLWPPVETAIRDLAKQRVARITALRKRERAPDPIDRMRRRADALTTGGSDLKRLAEATEPLYKTLDDGQKRRLFYLMRRVDRAHMRGAYWRSIRDRAEAR